MCRSSSVVFSLALACGGDRTAPVETGSPVELAIARELKQRYGVPIRVACDRDHKACTGKADGIAELPIRIEQAGSALDWFVEGLVVRADSIETYLRDELASMGAPQSVACGPRLRRVVAGDRLGCDLGGGGKAFATIAADGAMTYEIDLDPLAGEARSRDSSDSELLEQSRQLDVAEDDGD